MAICPHHPLRDLVLAADFLREKAPFLLAEIHHDRPRLEDADRRAAALRVVIDQRRHAVVGIELQELRLELVAAPDIAGDKVVIEAQLLEQDRDLLAVRCRPVVKLEHDGLP